MGRPRRSAPGRVLPPLCRRLCPNNGSPSVLSPSKCGMWNVECGMWNGATRSGAGRWREVRGEDIAERLIVLAVRVIRFQERLPRNRATLHIGMQLVRSITSAGAEYEETPRAR